MYCGDSGVYTLNSAWIYIATSGTKQLYRNWSFNKIYKKYYGLFAPHLSPF